MATSPSSAAGAGTPTIPPDWNPSQPECNLDEAGYYIWQWGIQQRVVLGGPSQTTECLPPGWGTDATFEATRCPSAYTPVPTACRWAPDAVICCPTAFAFSCYNSEATPFSGHSYYRCASLFPSRMSLAVTWTDLVSSTASVGRADVGTPAHLFAVAIVYTTPTGSPPADPTSPDSNAGPSGAPPPGSEPAADGLSANARIGIGVGVGVGVLLIAAAVFFMFRRRQRRPRDPAASASAAGSSSEAPKEAFAELADHQTSYPASAPSASPYPPYPVVPGRHEMEGDRRTRSELP